MVHLLLYNDNFACGSSTGGGSSLIQLVNCGRCHAWHNTNELAKSLDGSSDSLEETPAVELALCSCGCGEAFPKAQAKWYEGDSPYISMEHMAEHQWVKEADAFDEASADMNRRLHAEHQERRSL